MLIPGELIAILTFPGIIVHELGHYSFCRLTGLRVYKVCYFRFDNPAGYVLHEKLLKFFQTFFICVGPYIIGTILSIMFFIISSYFAINSILHGFLVWIGLSIAMHSFPSSGDAINLWNEAILYWKQNILVLLAFPFCIILWIANGLKFVWFDLIYGAILYTIVLYFMH